MVFRFPAGSRCSSCNIISQNFPPFTFLLNMNIFMVNCLILHIYILCVIKNTQSQMVVSVRWIGRGGMNLRVGRPLKVLISTAYWSPWRKKRDGNTLSPTRRIRARRLTRSHESTQTSRSKFFWITSWPILKGCTSSRHLVLVYMSRFRLLFLSAVSGWSSGKA